MIQPTPPMCKPNEHKWKARFMQGRIIYVCQNCPTYQDRKLEGEKRRDKKAN